ncbi:MAG: glycosyltransferase family 4 protein [Planctomycetota bacterium]
MPRIGVVTQWDLGSAWARSTSLGPMVERVAGLCDGLVSYGPVELWSDRVRAVAARASARVPGARAYSPHYSLRRSRELARIFRRRFEATPCDLVFAPKGSINLAFLELPVPVVYVSDATFALLDGYYPSVSGLSPRSQRAAHEAERLTLTRADALVFYTRWAADSAIRDYGADPARVHVLPVGPNLDPAALPPPEALLAQRDGSGPCRLLLVGVDWLRKGADVALETLEALEARGIDAELTVVGCKAPPGVRHPRLRVVPFLSKKDPLQRAELMSLFREASFLLVPTRAECYGCVFVEASAWALPSLATVTGGVPEVVQDGVNGFCFPLEARGEVYAERIAQLLADPPAYRALCASSRQRFEQALNWDAWAAGMAEIVRGLLG